MSAAVLTLCCQTLYLCVMWSVMLEMLNVI